MEQELGYTCPQTKKQCDDECCVSAEDCHAEAINNIISNCEPEQLNQNKMEQTAVEWLEKRFLETDGNLYAEDFTKAKKIFEQQIIEFANWLDKLSPSQRVSVWSKDGSASGLFTMDNEQLFEQFKKVIFKSE